MVPTEQKDLNALYENEMRIINSKAPKEENKVNPETKQEDYYKVNPFFCGSRATADELELQDERSLGLDYVECCFSRCHPVSPRLDSIVELTFRQTSSGTGSIATTYMGVLLYTVAGLACK
jgi:chitin synthase